MKWDVEEIPDEDDLFYRVPLDWTIDGEPHTGVFRENRGAMSADWAKYSTAMETLNRAVTSKPTPIGVIRLNTGKIREVKDLSVLHEPREENRAHSGVHGVGAGTSLEERRRRDNLRRDLYARFRTWEIKPRLKD